MAFPTDPAEPDPPAAAAAMSRFGRLMLKELRETLRDRRTILTLVGMPLLVYPLLGLVFQKYLLSQVTLLKAPEYHLAFATAEEAETLRALLHQAENWHAARRAPDDLEPEPQFRLMVAEPGHLLETIVADQQADLGLRLKRRRSGRWQVEFVQLEGYRAGRAAREALQSRLQALNDAFVAEVFRQHEPPLRLPVTWTVQWLAGPVPTTFSLAGIVPLILILMTVTGAVYPAIDLTAGERERGTLEALIAAPVPPAQILLAKYAVVMLVVLLTAVANLTAMTATSFATGLDRVLFGSGGFHLGLLVKLLLLLTVFACFFAAVILALTSLARSFKEAQAYLIPLMLASLAPGILAIFPGLEMHVVWSVTPLANIVLLAREVFDHRVQPLLAGLTVLSTLVYAGLALSLATRVFGADAVLYGSSATWSDLWRRPARPRSTPEWTLGLVALAGVLPAFVLLSGFVARAERWSPGGRLGANAAVLILLFVVWPGGLAWFRRVTWRGAWRMARPSVWGVLGAGCLGLSLWPFVYELVRWLSPVSALAEQFEELAAEIRSTPLSWRLGTLAVVPAVCEELFFRGFLLQAFREKLGGWTNVALTAVLFGLFHVLVGDTLLAVRFLPTTLLGLVLGWLSLHTGSVWPGMLLHGLHNSVLISLEDWAPWLGWDQALGAGEALSGWLLLGAGLLTAVGVTLVQRGGSKVAGSSGHLSSE